MTGDGTGYGVDTGTLVSTGQEFVDIADDTAEAANEFTGRAEGYEASNKGFETTSTAASLTGKWSGQLDDLAKRTSVAGELLQTGSDSYEKMEQQVREVLPSLNSDE